MEKAFKTTTIKLTTLGYINLKTSEFFRTKAEWIKSTAKSELDKFNKRISNESAAMILICLTDIKMAKAKLIKGYSWRKSCIIATCKSIYKKVKLMLGKDSRELFFN